MFLTDLGGFDTCRAAAIVPTAALQRLLAEHGEIQLSALGFAVATLVTVAELLKKDKLAVEKSAFARWW